MTSHDTAFCGLYSPVRNSHHARAPRFLNLVLAMLLKAVAALCHGAIFPDGTVSLPSQSNVAETENLIVYVENIEEDRKQRIWTG